MSNVQLPGSKIFDFQMKMHTGNQKDDVSLAKEFQHHTTKEHQKMVCLIREKNYSCVLIQRIRRSTDTDAHRHSDNNKGRRMQLLTCINATYFEVISLFIVLASCDLTINILSVRT